jgi:hypothetical protein
MLRDDIAQVQDMVALITKKEIKDQTDPILEKMQEIISRISALEKISKKKGKTDGKL